MKWTIAPLYIYKLLISNKHEYWIYLLRFLITTQQKENIDTIYKIKIKKIKMKQWNLKQF